jgi:hypothetical protein
MYKRQVERENSPAINGGPPDLGYAEHYAEWDDGALSMLGG